MTGDGLVAYCSGEGVGLQSSKTHQIPGFEPVLASGTDDCMLVGGNRQMCKLL